MLTDPDADYAIRVVAEFAGYIASGPGRYLIHQRSRGIAVLRVAQQPDKTRILHSGTQL
jgi:hypothetical protein